MSILIQNGTLICPDGPVKADLRVEGDKIAQIGPALPVGDSQVIDAAGKLLRNERIGIEPLKVGRIEYRVTDSLCSQVSG